MKNDALFSESSLATYCPEDDKLRLYVGRVPREEYLALKAEGWTSTPKQTCDFVAVWTPRREDTCISYAGEIEDEDQSPTDRAADRAERFAGYAEKRLGEAVGHADRYDEKPAAHGYQNAAKGEREASKHDRIAARAVRQWDKAEYWQHRTAGVISTALYRSEPGVRMGRIKVIEADIRKREKDAEDFARRVRNWTKVAKLTADPEKQTRLAIQCANESCEWGDYEHPRDPSRKRGLYSLLTSDRDPITGAEAADLWLEQICPPDLPEYQETGGQRTLRHLKLRLAYELQMLEAAGGRAAMVEMQPGGFIGKFQIWKVNKSPATGRVVSVQVLAPRRFSDDGKESLQTINIERLEADAYREGTPEEVEAWKVKRDAHKAENKKPKEAPLINPTKEDAERLQKILCDRHRARYIEKNAWDKDCKYYNKDHEREVLVITQAVYSANSSGSYARVETRGLHADCELADRESNLYSSAAVERRKRIGPALCKIRVGGYDPVSIIHLTDKPAKPLPAEVWEALATVTP